MALATRTSRRSLLRTLWGSSLGKKALMAGTGVIMLLFLTMHMLGNLKIFFGPDDFNSYAAWLRTIGEPALHEGWYLWLQRTGLVACVVLHIVAVHQVHRLADRARPQKYVHKPPTAGRRTFRTMRWAGVAIALFIVWHILDLTAGTVNPRGEAGHPYENVVADFTVWYPNLIYMAAVLALGAHIRHGFWSATQTLGINNRRRNSALMVTGNIWAVVLTAGFLAVPIAVMTGLVD
jgi:succinate dehydrogenase / fumarate reductase cytochrome b subunit